MGAPHGQMKCKIFPSAFSGEVVFQVNTINKQRYAGVAPKHFVQPNAKLPKDGIDGQIKVRVLGEDANAMRVYLPDGQVLTVSADKVRKHRRMDEHCNYQSLSKKR